MQSGYVTTPFGRRSMTLALVQRQVDTEQANNKRPVEKWRVFRDVGDARERLGLQDRALAVLNALLSFYPAVELSEDNNLVVFPSNVQLTARANGISGTTLRKCLASLVDAGVIIRKDSPNGKRYARKGSGGSIEDAYGFSLSPLLARAAEFASLAQEVAAEQRRFRMMKDRLSVVRRDVRKLITAGLEEGVPGNWQAVEDCFVEIVSRIPRRPSTADILDRLDEMTLLHEEVVSILEDNDNSKKPDSNAIVFGCHIQNSKSESCNESEPALEKVQGEKPASINERERKKKPQVFPLSVVLAGCPEIAGLGPAGGVSSWRELMSAAVTVRSMLGISPSAYQDACEVLGDVETAIAVACIYERSNHITSAGGYLRNLTDKAKRGKFSLGPMLYALVRQSSSTIGRRA
ncbi:replication initiation protein RepC [Rhizobiales bacterium RZME27]|uniref:Replication initiation protein RepC n=1 Tax=Endobacterium cereale TaxID=2663029 RepID=A0A6A8ACL5_9HYPH|nr:plasmid replication protein RepC [Endobacterium cereale]MEB2846604.1 plasmid replication protein RepC [Endobacterium cereale]MQY46471.1 replication initiation protein RepC [Endobacterium cereale]